MTNALLSNLSILERKIKAGEPLDENTARLRMLNFIGEIRKLIEAGDEVAASLAWWINPTEEGWRTQADDERALKGRHKARAIDPEPAYFMAEQGRNPVRFGDGEPVLIGMNAPSQDDIAEAQDRWKTDSC